MIHIARPGLGQEEKDAVLAVMDSGMIASGAVVSDFEKAFSTYIGMPCAVACSSGTTALELALRALGIGSGDKVLTTSYSFIASANCAVYVGASPVFTDIDPTSFLMTPAHVRDALEKHPDIKAIIAVHLFGQPCDMEAIMDIAKQRNLLVIEDCAQSHGAMFNGKKAGSFGDAACFSFYPTKNMTTSEGGMVLFKDPEISEKCRLLVSHGMKERYHHEIIGYNYRMTNIAAAIGIEQLKKLLGYNKARQRNAARLNKYIANPLIQTPMISPGCEHVFHQYTIKAQDRPRLAEYLQSKEIGYGIFYPLTIPEQKCYAGMGFETSFPCADTVKEEAISLPVHPALTKEELDRIADAVNSFK
jgi:perosamine synthetase